ncbi:hypothetical protein NM208_g9994 [Fusarium decemcellulare]|uniref:Uncharacterized protein n=2 Tax=Fusarium decemcellulare TaxID=57161 RepID=A0ACC1RW87_9HYPO|nr:hypothetical protein NM208_g10897 [Fusarium decemcellulare]KAJ3528913.1 hypothetical protein NM208_g9994 [Fusarium decemcellulare]
MALTTAISIEYTEVVDDTPSHTAISINFPLSYYLESLPDQERASSLPPEFEEQRVIEQTSLMHYKFLDGLREAIQDDQDIARPLLAGSSALIQPLLEEEKTADIARLVSGTGHRLTLSLVEAVKSGKENMTKRLVSTILGLLEHYDLSLTQGDNAKNLKLILDLARTNENDKIVRHVYDFMTLAIDMLWDRGARAAGVEDGIIDFTHFGLGWLCLHFPRDTASRTPYLVISHVKELSEMIVRSTAVQRVEAFAFNADEQLCEWIDDIAMGQDWTLSRLLKTMLTLIRFLLESHLASKYRVRFIKLATTASRRFLESFIVIICKRSSSERILRQYIASLYWLMQTPETVDARDTLVKTATTLGLNLSFKCLVPWNSNEVTQVMLPAHPALIGVLASVSKEDQAMRMFDRLLLASLMGMDATDKGMELLCFLDMRELFTDLWHGGHGAVVEKLLQVRRHRLEPFICMRAGVSSAVGMEVLVNANSDSSAIHQSLLEEGAADAVVRAALGTDFTVESFSKQSLVPSFY